MPYSMSPANGRVNRVEKLIINLDTAMPLSCAWDECDRRARTPYQVRTHEHPAHWDCRIGRHSVYAFCADRHRQYWLNSSGRRAHETAARNRGLIYGQLPEGMRNVL